MAHLTKLQEYDAARRDAATKAGGPVLRTAAPGLTVLPGDDTFMARLDTKSGRLQLAAWSDPSLRLSLDPCDLADFVLTDEVLAAMLSGGQPIDDDDDRDEDEDENDGEGEAPALPRGAWVVFPDLDTFHKVYRIVSRLRDGVGMQSENARRTLRVLDVAKGTPVQGRIAVLTDALTAKYWAPTGMDTRNLAAWSATFGLRDLPFVQVMQRLIARATTYDGPQITGRGGKPRKTPAEQVRVSEFHALKSAWFGSSGMSAVKAYRSADRLSDTWSAVLLADEHCEERNIIAGKANVWFQPGMLSSLKVTGEVSQPFMSKVGRKVNLYAPGDPYRTVGSGVIDQVSVAGDGSDRIMLTLSFSKTPGAVTSVVGAQELVVREQPYLTSASKTRGEAWLGDGGGLPPIVDREIPLAIALAGAPSI